MGWRGHRRIRLGGALIAFGMLALATAVAEAQERRVPLANDPLGQGQTVFLRARPETDALGIPVFGPSLLYPSFEQGVGYDDNVFAANRNRIGDFYSITAPALRLRSDWGRQRLNFDAGARIGRYSDQSGEDFNDANASLNGITEIHDGLVFSGAVQFIQGHESRQEPTNIFAVNQVPVFRTWGASATLAQTGYRFGLGGTLSYERTVYDNVTANQLFVLGGTPQRGDVTVFENTRNVDKYRGEIRPTFEILPDATVFITASLETRQYERRPNEVPGQVIVLQSGDFLDRFAPTNQIPARDSVVQRYGAGFTYQLTDLLDTSLTIGYLNQNFRNGIYQDIKTPYVTLRAVWQPTTLTSLDFTVDRQPIDLFTFANGIFASGAIRTTGFVNLQHELLRDFLLAARFGVIEDGFASAQQRTDQRLIGGFSAKYLLSRYASAQASWTYTERYSYGANATFPFTQNLLLLSLRLQL